MRVSRALKKMKHYLRRRNGVAVTVALLTALLAQRAVHPAPCCAGRQSGI
jgi:hypothetical protein